MRTFVAFGAISRNSSNRFDFKRAAKQHDAGNVATRMVDALYQSVSDRIPITKGKHDGNC